MRFRFTLHSEERGSEVLQFDPVGWDKMEVLIKRGTDTHGFFYEQAVNLQFTCGAGKEYIDDLREDFGIDVEIGITIEIACSDCDPGVEFPDYSIDYSDDYGSMIEGTCIWEEFYEGLLDMKTWNGTKNFTSIDIIESSFFRTVRNRMNTVVDLLSTETIDGTELESFTYGPYDLNLHSKALLLISEVDMVSSLYQEEITLIETATIYFTFPFDFINVAELEQVNIPSPPLITSTSGTPTIQSIYFNPLDEDIDIEVDYTFIGNIKEFFNKNRVYTLSLVYNINNTGGVAGAVSIQNFGFKSILASLTMTQVVNLTGTLNLTIPSGHSLHIYIVLANYIGAGPVSPSATSIGFECTEASIIIQSVSVTDTSIGKAFARFETGARICQVIADRTDAFRSTYFGRTNSQPFAYDENGYGSFASILSGFWVRGFPITGEFARTTKMTLNQYFRDNSAIENLGLGIEKIDGTHYVVMERMDYFYDSSTVLLTFNNVPDIVTTEATEYYFARVNIGYSKWETKFRNGLEEPNSKRFYDLGIKSIESTNEIYSGLVAGGYRIENARRLQYFDNPTSDSEFDEDNHLIYLNRTVDIDGTPTMLDVAEKDENFDTVTNLLSPETSYNLRGSVARNYLRRNDIINPSLLKYPGRVAKFMGGEGNYKMETKFTSDDGPGRWNNELLTEGQNIQWDDANNSDNNPLWIPEIVTFKFPLSFAEFKTIKDNPKGVIMVSETDTDHIPYYILEIKYLPGNGGLSDFKLLRAFVA